MKKLFQIRRSLIYSFLLFSLYSASQDQQYIDARKFITSLAATSGAEQQEIQTKIKEINWKIDSLKKKYSNHPSLKTDQELSSSKESLRFMQVDLKNKMKTGKHFKEMLLLDDRSLWTAVKKEFPDKNFLNERGMDPKTMAIHDQSDDKTRRAKDKSTQTSPSQPHIDATNLDHSIKDNQAGTQANSIQINANRDKEKIESSLRDRTLYDCLETTYVPFVCNPKINGPVKTLVPELLYTYTPEEIKKYLKGNIYEKGFAFIGQEPGYTYLQLNIEIASTQALSQYGSLNKSFISLKLINGEEIRLVVGRFDNGSIDNDKRITLLSGVYYLEKKDEKALLTSEVDTMRLHYASGYEDFTIFNTDFFIRQLNCINSIK